MGVIHSGRLRNRVTFQRKQGAQNALGQTVLSWLSVQTVWAEIAPLFGREYLEAYKATAPVSTRITIRFPRGFAPEPQTWRAVHDMTGRIYDIQSTIDRDLAHTFLDLMCSTGSNDGR